MNHKKECICQLHTLVQLLNTAATHASAGRWEKATDTLQGQAVPLLQQVTHTVWLNHHKSGTGAV